MGSTRRKSSSPPASTAPDGAAAPASDQEDQLPGAPTAEDLGLDRGFIGDAVDPRPNEAYSQETDPTVSPGAADVVNDGRYATPQEDAA